MSTRTAVADVRGRPAFERGARLGYAANGVLNLVVGWLALQVAWGGGGQDASASGALRALADTPLGGALLWVLLVGFALLGLCSSRPPCSVGVPASDSRRPARA